MQAKPTFRLCFCVEKRKLLRQYLNKFFDRDSNLKIFLLPGLETQKVEKHWPRRPNGLSYVQIEENGEILIMVILFNFSITFISLI